MSQSKMEAKVRHDMHPRSIPAGHRKTRGNEKRHKQHEYAFCRTQKGFSGKKKFITKGTHTDINNTNNNNNTSY